MSDPVVTTPTTRGRQGPESGSPQPAPGAVRRVERDGEVDLVAVEEPLEIRLGAEPIAVTMRTPGHDEELAAGFLSGEGLIAGPLHIGLTEDLAANTVEVCGKGALEEVAVNCGGLAAGPRVARKLLGTLPERLVQPGFTRTGGLHATGLFDARGELICVREDVGRHNAMDKVVGWGAFNGLLPLHGHILCVSGRLSFELVQKAAVAGAPILVGVGAPTSLAVELARERGLTLCGFARREQVNVYTGAERVL